MEYRNLGNSGLQVRSPGSAATTSAGASTSRQTWRSSERALEPASTSSTPPTSTAIAASRRSSWARRSRAAAARRDRRDEVRRRRWARGRTWTGALAALHDRRGRGEPAAARTDYIDLYQVHCPDADDADRRDAARARRPGARRQGALHRLLELHRLADRGCPVGRADEGPEPFISAQNQYNLLDRRVEREVVRRLRALRARHAALLPARERLPHRQVPRRRAAARRHAPRRAGPTRHASLTEPTSRRSAARGLRRSSAATR